MKEKEKSRIQRGLVAVRLRDNHISRRHQRLPIIIWAASIGIVILKTNKKGKKARFKKALEL